MVDQIGPKVRVMADTGDILMGGAYGTLTTWAMVRSSGRVICVRPDELAADAVPRTEDMVHFATPLIGVRAREGARQPIALEATHASSRTRRVWEIRKDVR